MIQPAGELAQCLRHQTSLQTNVSVPHVTLNLGAGHQCGNGVHHHEVDRARAHQHVRNFEGLLSGIGLRDQELVNIHTQCFCIIGIQRVLRIHKRGDSAVGLGVGNRVEGECGFTRGLGAINLDDAAARQTADAERDIESNRTGGNNRNGWPLVRAESHDRPFSKLAINLRESRLKGFFAVCGCGHVMLLFLFVFGCLSAVVPHPPRKADGISTRRKSRELALT